MAELSPMMKQYFEIKEKYPNTLVFYRLGDFYEMFFEDAKIASQELDLTLTGRDCGLDERAPMCGVPFHSCDGYIAKLIQKGYKVAICEQVEDPALSKGLVKRDVVRVITPGTLIESSILDAGKNNYICSVFAKNKKCGIAFCDISTGKLTATQIEGHDFIKRVKNEILSCSPNEIICNSEVLKLKGISEYICERIGVEIEATEDADFDCSNSLFYEYFPNAELSESDYEQNICSISAVCGLMGYLKRTQMNGLERISVPKFYKGEQFMLLDFNTKRNLELLQTMHTGEKKGSLLWVLDKTQTAMGKRLLRTWIERPLLACNSIINRQNSVSELVHDVILRSDLSDALKPMIDIQRLMTKVTYGSVSPKEIYSLGLAFGQIPCIKNVIAKTSSRLLKDSYNKMDDLSDLHELIMTAISEKAPITSKDGGIFNEGYSKEADELRVIMNDSSSLLAKIEAREKEATGIPKLKIGYNRVFGYYIEVTNMYKDLVPETYIRKQTLTNCERYITQELKNLEGTILGARERCCKLEYDLFQVFVKQISAHLLRIEQTIDAIAVVDVLMSLAQVASDNRYCRPEVNNSGKIIVKESRHPVVELLLKNTPFVPNNIYLDNDSNRTAIITGPNMAGKSTYMRQAALITIMAQIGSYVPAESAEIGITDAVFTRIGASDDLTTGQSTFMVEMNEVANIIKSATKNSLLILDEIGRGTSTYDGMSIARSVLEYVTDKKTLGAKTLFATHYHELTILENLMDGVKNYNIAVKKRGFDITFLRRIVPGGADESYGVEVAKLAGIPESIIMRAKEVLSELEGQSDSKPITRNVSQNTNSEETLFSLLDTGNNKIIDELRNIDINTLTPIEAMKKLYDLVSMAKDT